MSDLFQKCAGSTSPTGMAQFAFFIQIINSPFVFMISLQNKSGYPLASNNFRCSTDDFILISNFCLLPQYGWQVSKKN